MVVNCVNYNDGRCIFIEGKVCDAVRLPEEDHYNYVKFNCTAKKVADRISFKKSLESQALYAK